MKRKGDINADLGASGVKKTRAWGKGKAKLDVEPSNWPLYFQNLNKVKFHSNLRRALTESSEQLSIQALNTVLAFVSSRKQLATTFPVIRSSVEGLLKQPLELSKVAELKALLPDLIKFAYIPPNDLRIHENTQAANAERPRARSPDFNLASVSARTVPTLETEEHVLVLEFAENSKGKKSPANTSGSIYSLFKYLPDAYY
ncbi:hypothetical protein HWV62_10102 [Athelia sp. TMB]|nr:hypothetical protein HWV62_10102 [Athelia sp. TMB]